MSQAPDSFWIQAVRTSGCRAMTRHVGKVRSMKNLSVSSLLLFAAAAAFQGCHDGPASPASTTGGGRERPTYPVSTDVRTTRERTVRAAALPAGTAQLTLEQVEAYAPLGYSSWSFGAPVDYGALTPDRTNAGSYSTGPTLLTFFTMSDVHIVDKESPSQAIFMGTSTNPGEPPQGFGNANTSAYSPVMLSTTHVLDAAVQTINALHAGPLPFDFGIALGDDANSNQYNELRWFIDVMDGKTITPSSGAHRGAGSIDYQKPYQAAGLNSSIPWYQTLGNHDQYWCGTLRVNDYDRRVLVGNTVISIALVGPTAFPSFDGHGYYMGVVDGSTEYGSLTGYGSDSQVARPVIAADPQRRALATATSSTLGWMEEFRNTASQPVGHGFTQTNLDRDFASYSFEPKAKLPLKVIVLDDTCKENPYAADSSYARACLDQERYDWLVRELDQGQADGKLMIIAAHIPVGPLSNVPDFPVKPGGMPNEAHLPLFLSSPTCGASLCALDQYAPLLPYTVVTDHTLLEKLHDYSNLILWISGHRHINTVTPQPAPAASGPAYGFWEVETSSLRDFPQQFRTFRIAFNSNKTISIFVTNVDPAVQADPAAQPGSPAAKSRGYAIGANRIAAGNPSAFTDTTAHVYNAELVKPLSSEMQAKLLTLFP